MRIKESFTPPYRAGPLARVPCLYRTFSSHLGGIQAKSSEILPSQAGSLLIKTYY